jgi:hypothetical protein
MAESTEPTTDVVSRSVRIGRWENFLPAPDRATQSAQDLATVAALSRDVVRFRVKKPGNTNHVDPARLCQMLSPKEDLGFHDRLPDRFENGIGKNYEGYRIAFVEGEGFYRIENDGRESAASPIEAFNFRADLAVAAQSDENIRKYISSKKFI